MAEDPNSSAEKSQEPTPRRLEKAREDGDTARSRELNTTAILLTGCSALLLFGGTMAQALASMMCHNLSLSREQVFDTSAMVRHLSVSIMHGLTLLGPLFGVLLVAAILGPIALGGWNFALKSVIPKGSRMNPLSGLKRMFGPKALVELVKALGKVIVVVALGLLMLALSADRIVGLQQLDVVVAMPQALRILGWAVLVMSCAMIIIAAIDIPYQLYSHNQKLRMTMQQVKEEAKDTDGKPEVKQRIRQLQFQMSQNRMMAAVPQADVVIVNPQHYAVALRYQQAGSPSAPQLVAKGVDLVALKIREVAQAHDIPVVEAPVLARAIYYHTSLEQEIPEGLYRAVAQVLAYIFQLRSYRPGSGPRPKLADHLPVPSDLRHD